MLRNAPAAVRVLLRRLLLVALPILSPTACPAVQITLDFTLDAQNENWFNPQTPIGSVRRSIVESAAQFLSDIVVTDDWQSIAIPPSTITLTDIAASEVNDLNGVPVLGSPEGDGAGFEYNGANGIAVTNRSAVAANEYVVYVGAFAFDAGASAGAKGGWSGGSPRNTPGAQGQAFNAWGGRVYFNTNREWYLGLNPGADPTDDYGVQDSDKNPLVDITTDNWDWSTASDSWKGFDLRSIDANASGKRDLYGTALHELIHALGATSSPIVEFVRVDAAGDFVGTHLVEEFGGPVPGDGGHFAANVQSLVWASDGIVSEAVLDPNSTSGVRKYLTNIDAALLKDLGYDVLDAFAPAGDYNADGVVDAADFTVWRDNLGTDFNAADGDRSGAVDVADYLIWRTSFAGSTGAAAGQPVPSAASLPAAIGGVVWGFRRREAA